MDSTDVQMAHAVAVMGTSGYCGLPRQRAKKCPNAVSVRAIEIL